MCKLHLFVSLLFSNTKIRKNGLTHFYRTLPIELYYRQYLAYKKDRDVYVLVNLFKYNYIIYPNDGTLSAICPPKAITIISLAKDKSRKRNDNITVLLNLSTKQIVKISYV